MNKLDIKIANIANITRVSHDYAGLKYRNPRPGYNKKVNMLTIDRHGNIESKECILYLYDRTSLNIIKRHELQNGDILIPKRLSNALPIYIDDASIYKVNNTLLNIVPPYFFIVRCNENYNSYFIYLNILNYMLCNRKQHSFWKLDDIKNITIKDIPKEEQDDFIQNYKNIFNN